jgi:hypothetical protein
MQTTWLVWSILFIVSFLILEIYAAVTGQAMLSTFVRELMTPWPFWIRFGFSLGICALALHFWYNS